MSIIERALDKLGTVQPKDKLPAKKREKTVAARRKAGTAEPENQKLADSLATETEKQSSSSIPELHESVTEQYQKPTASKSQERNDQKRFAMEEMSSFNPEIFISKLDVEGILSPKGGRSRLAEEYRLIKRPLLVKAFTDTNSNAANTGILHNNVVMVSSSVAGEGKTFTSLNLAISIAMEMDQTVLLIDSDLAKPGLSKLLDIRGEKGLTDYLSGDVKDIGTLLKRTDIPKLTVLGAGSSHSRSTELLASRTMARLLDELAQRYPDRMIIFDSPPLLATTESVVLSRQMGQVCLVVESSSTPQYMVKQALGSLHSTDNVSLILNKVKPDLLSTGYGYGYGYGHGYGET